MKRKTTLYFKLLCFWMIIGIPMFSMATIIPSPPSGLSINEKGTILPPPTPLGGDSLLPGMTPKNYTIPSGWSVLRTQDFEGTCPAGEWCGRWSGSITTTRPHTGSRSVEGSYPSDQADAGWSLEEGHTGYFSEIYLSFYEFIESQALFNDEFWMAQFVKSNPFQEVIAAWLWARNDQGRPAFNTPNMHLYAVSQGNKTERYAGVLKAVPKAAWVQWEIHYRPNTPANSDGFFRVYKDGTLYTSAENVNLNGTLSMENVAVQAGGLYTKLVWMTDSPTCSSCSSAPGEGTDYCSSSKGWFGQSFSSPICGPSLPSFIRYFDDIILMKK